MSWLTFLDWDFIPNITLFDLQGERGPQGDEGRHVKFYIVVQVALNFLVGYAVKI